MGQRLPAGGQFDNITPDEMFKLIWYTLTVPRKSPAPAERVPTLGELREAILSVAREHGVRNVRVFGSFARGEQRKSSDVDLLVDFPEHFSLLDVAGLKNALEEATGRKVDVISERRIKPALRDAILSDARPL